MPITQNSHSSKSISHSSKNFITAVNCPKNNVLSKITIRPDFLTAKGRLKAPILIYWPPVRYLLLPLVQNSGLMQYPGFMVICHSVIFWVVNGLYTKIIDECDQNAFSMNVTFRGTGSLHFMLGKV